MWIVRLALNRPYTFVVMAVLIAVLGGISILSMPKDIFPYIDIPVVTVVWTYTGIAPVDMANRITTLCERAMTSTVSDIEHMESSSYNGTAVIRVYFRPNVKIDLAIAQVTAINQTIERVLPPGIFPPQIIKYDASSVPILQLGVASRNLSEAELFDLGQNFIRTQLATIEGASIPLPYGGAQRQIMIDIDPGALYSKNLSATDISNAINQQNLILPAGSAKIGARDYFVQLNSSPATVPEMNDLPVKTVNGNVVFMRDVAQVHDGFAVQTNIVRENGRRSTLLTVLKNGQASTLDIVREIREALPRVLAGMPKGLEIKPLFDQSLFVQAAMNGVAREAVIAAGLTALMILLFLGSWRSTVIVCASIPLSILTSCVILWAFGHTLNVMTLGGMALAVGILVDDATVEIENIHRNMGMRHEGRPNSLTRAILEGARQIAVPAFVSTLAICIVFVPVLLLTGPAKFLFTPLAFAVVFAMLMSYVLSRTLIPTMAHYMLPVEAHVYAMGEEGVKQAKGLIWSVHHAFNRLFELVRERYERALAWCLHHRLRVTVVYILFVGGSLTLAAFVGSDFFPTVDAGQLRMHLLAPEGTRLEETEKVFGAVEQTIRENLQPGELEEIVDNIGIPNPVNLAFGDSSTASSADGDILISLKEGHHRPTAEVERLLRKAIHKKFPDENLYFQAANITNQILNFGIPAPVDIQIAGRNTDGNYKIAREIEQKLARLPGAVDVHMRQQVNTPALAFNIDRAKASQAGLTQRDVASSLLISLSSSLQTAPNQWLNPLNGVNYNVAVQTPQYKMDSIDAIRRTPVTSAAGGNLQLFDNVLGSVKRTTTTTLISHYNVQPVFDVMANIDQRDLGGLSSDISRVLADVKKHLPPATTIAVRGQIETMESSFRRLGFGMVFAILLVYLLMVVNFQSWLDPFIILTALPGAFAGILWMLYATGTTLNVPSLMGSIMAIGVATANSILVVTFANDERLAGKNQIEAALSAGVTRIRPVLMTAAAMIIGMLPMALGMGEGGEQNAPLGRAVIGGLLFATFSTLFFVPLVYSLLRRTPPVDQEKLIAAEAEA